MNIEEMKAHINEYCDYRMDCHNSIYETNCPLHLGAEKGCAYNADNEECVIKCYETLFGKEEEVVETEPTPPINDVINKPNHYCRDGAMECIDEMVLLFGKEAVKHFCLCNIWKYRYRSAAKNGEEDIKKSDRYVQIYKELCSNE
jgi:hypothetical protein